MPTTDQCRHLFLCRAAECCALQAPSCVLLRILTVKPVILSSAGSSSARTRSRAATRPVTRRCKGCGPTAHVFRAHKLHPTQSPGPHENHKETCLQLPAGVVPAPPQPFEEVGYVPERVHKLRTHPAARLCRPLASTHA